MGRLMLMKGIRSLHSSPQVLERTAVTLLTWQCALAGKSDHLLMEQTHSGPGVVASSHRLGDLFRIEQAASMRGA